MTVPADRPDISHLLEPRDDLSEDMERLVEIAEHVLAGTPIEDFELGEGEIHVVVGYCQRAYGLR